MDVERDRDEGAERRRRWLKIAGGLTAVATVATALFALDPAIPTVERSAILIARVERGPLVRQVRGPGRLVPERMRVVSAVTAGRVESVRVQPGQSVESATVLLELSNPDVELEALEAQRQLTAARAELLDLRHRLGSQVLEARTSLAAARVVWLAAARQARRDSTLAARALIPADSALRSGEQADAAGTELAVRRERLALLEETQEGQLAVQREQVERLRSIHSHRRRRVESMRVTAGAAGVVQDFDLQPGEWVQSGTELARVAEPSRLKAELQIAQTQARDVRAGQRAVIDTRNDTLPGQVSRVDPNVQNGTVRVEVALDGPLPTGARPDLVVDGYIEIERLDTVLHVGRPAFAQARTPASVFRLGPDGREAVRTEVRFGAGSVDRIQVLAGLAEGDRIVVSDLSRFADEERIRIE